MGCGTGTRVLGVEPEQDPTVRTAHAHSALGLGCFTKTYIGTKLNFNASVSASAHHMLKTTQSVLTKGWRNDNATISREAKVIKVQGNGSRL